MSNNQRPEIIHEIKGLSLLLNSKLRQLEGQRISVD